MRPHYSGDIWEKKLLIKGNSNCAEACSGNLSGKSKAFVYEMKLIKWRTVGPKYIVIWDTVGILAFILKEMKILNRVVTWCSLNKKYIWFFSWPTENKPLTIEKTVIGSYILIITLNGNGFNAQTKRYTLTGWTKTCACMYLHLAHHSAWPSPPVICDYFI